MENEIIFFISYPEVPLTLYKGNANRMENEIIFFISYPEVPLSLYKGNNNFYYEKQSLFFY